MGPGSPSRTPDRDILPVPAGQAVRSAAGITKASAFWNLPVDSRIRYHDDRQYDEHLRWLFRDAVRTRLRTTSPDCSELSGGLDSSSIVCMAAGLVVKPAAGAPPRCHMHV